MHFLQGEAVEYSYQLPASQSDDFERMSNGETIIHSVAARRVNAILEVAQCLGVSRKSLLENSGIREEWLVHNDNRLPVGGYLELYEKAVAATGCPDLGIFAGRVSFLTESTIQQYLSTFCSTFREYLNRVPSIINMSGDIGEVAVAKENALIRLEWRPTQPDSAGARYLADEVLCTSAMIINSLCIMPIPLIKACFTYPEPTDLTQLRLAFGKSISFEQSESCLYYDKTVLDYPLIRAGSGLGENAVQAMQAYFGDEEANDPFLHNLRDCIARSLPEGAVALDVIAHELALSRRTLQRRLEKRRTSFQKIVQDVRAQLALRYLMDGRVGITETAFLLGYAEPASFTKAFKAWYGSAPSDYVKRKPAGLRRPSTLA